MKIALISCVKTKRDKACPAKDMYISSLFKKNFAFAKQNCDKVFILSAKYGLLDECDVIEPYEMTLNKMKKEEREKWAERVIERLKNASDLQNDEFVILAGTRYRENLLSYIKKYKIPFEGLSLGRQLQKLREVTNDNV